MGRIDFENHSADRNHVLNSVLRRVPKGKTNPKRIPVDYPAVMSRHIKRVAKYLGLDVVGIGRSHPSLLYAGKGLAGRHRPHWGRTARSGGPTSQEFPLRHRRHCRLGLQHDQSAQAPDRRRRLRLYRPANESHPERPRRAYSRDGLQHASRRNQNGQAAALAAGVGELGAMV